MACDGDPIFKTPEDFIEAANAYFDECDRTGELYSPAGLQLGLKKYGKNHRFVARDTLVGWYNGETNPALKPHVQEAYARIEHQIETDPRYQDKSMQSRAIFLLKQHTLGGMRDVQKEDKTKVEVVLKHGDSVDNSDFA